MAGTNGIARRIAGMEIALRGREPDPNREASWAERDWQREEEQDRLLDELGRTMDVRRFVELTRPGAALDGQPTPAEHVRHVWREIDALCQQHSAGYLQQRFALHPAVVEALLRHGRAAWVTDGGCAACRLPMPFRLHGPLEGFGCATGERVFLRCPDCGSDEIRNMRGRTTRPLDGAA